MGKVTPVDEAKKREQLDAVFALIADGVSVRNACEQVGVVRRTFRDWVRKDEDLHAQYMRAREACAVSQFEEMEDLEHEVYSGAIDSNTFRVLLDSKKWRFGKMHKQFSDKQVIEQTTKHEGCVTVSHDISPEIASAIGFLFPTEESPK